MQKKLGASISVSLGVLQGRVLIRTEEERDRAAVCAVNTAAFETPLEAKLVDALRQQAQPVARRTDLLNRE